MDAGVGEAAAAEGAKTAGEAVGAEALSAEAAGAVGAGELTAGDLGAASTGLIGDSTASAAAGDLAAGAIGASGAGDAPTGSAGAFDASGVGTGVDAGIGMSDAGLSELSAGGTSGVGGVGGGGTAGDASADFGGDTVLGSQGEGGLTDVVQNASRAKNIKDALDKLEKYGPLVLGGAGALQQRFANAANAKKIAALGGPQRDIGQQLLAQFQSGTLSPADAGRIAQWEQSAIAQSRQFFSRAGTSSSTQANAAEAQIKAQAEQMRQQALQTTLKTGMDALNITDQHLAAAIQAEMQGDQQATQNAFNFLNAYGAWMRMQQPQTGQKAA